MVKLLQVISKQTSAEHLDVIRIGLLVRCHSSTSSFMVKLYITYAYYYESLSHRKLAQQPFSLSLRQRVVR